jgi:3-oxoacyl-[acyl-carrier-protein] synthase-1
MSAPAIAIQRTGLVTSVGLSAGAACAAIRAKVQNPSDTGFMNSGGQWISAHQVPLGQPLRGLPKLGRMAAMAIEEALDGIPLTEWRQLTLLLCVAEPERPGRMAGLDDKLFALIEAELGARFAENSAIVARGRVAVAVALSQARTLVAKEAAARVLVVAVDSLLSGPTLQHYDQRGRLLSETNSDGFMPGEAAGALLLGKPAGLAGELLCTGVGFAREPAPLDSGEPLRAEGLSQAIKAVLADAGAQLHEMDFRIADLSGEQYYFKEAALSLSRTMRTLKEEFDLWHPAECTGEVGAAAGTTLLALAKAACDKRYAKGPHILVHMANDAGERAALTLRYQGNA